MVKVHVCGSKVETPGLSFPTMVLNSILDLEIMFLGQVYTLNSILESILNDSGHIMKNFQKIDFSMFMLHKDSAGTPSRRHGRSSK